MVVGPCWQTRVRVKASVYLLHLGTSYFIEKQYFDVSVTIWPKGYFTFWSKNSFKVSFVEESRTFSTQPKNISGHLKGGREPSHLLNLKLISLKPLVFLPVVLIDRRVEKGKVCLVASNIGWQSFKLDQASPINRTWKIWNNACDKIRQQEVPIYHSTRIESICIYLYDVSNRDPLQ